MGTETSEKYCFRDRLFDTARVINRKSNEGGCLILRLMPKCLPETYSGAKRFTEYNTHPHNISGQPQSVVENRQVIGWGKQIWTKLNTFKDSRSNV